MNIFNRLLGIAPEPTGAPQNDEDKFAEQIAADILIEFEKWIKPELAKFIGEANVEKIKDADFEAVLQSQAHQLFLKKGITVNKKKNSGIFTFKLCKGTTDQHKVLSKFRYEMSLDKQEE